MNDESTTRRTLAGREVFPLVVGTAGTTFDHADDPSRLPTLVGAARDMGVNVFDTAVAYSTAQVEGHAEIALRQALHSAPFPEPPLIVTKGGHHRDGDTFPVDGRPATLRRHLEGSLRRLGVDRVGVYLLHHPDPATPIEESIAALEGFRAEGLVDTIGVSNVDLALYRRARSAGPVRVVQNARSLYRPGDEAVLAACEADGVAFLAYSPLAGASAAPAGLQRAVAGVAARHGLTTSQVALAWSVATSPVTLPVTGASRPETLASSVTAVRVALDADELAVLGRALADPAVG